MARLIYWQLRGGTLFCASCNDSRAFQGSRQFPFTEGSRRSQRPVNTLHQDISLKDEKLSQIVFRRRNYAASSTMKGYLSLWREGERLIVAGRCAGQDLRFLFAGRKTGDGVESGALEMGEKSARRLRRRRRGKHHCAGDRK